jgi:hypothetical protein
MEENPNEILQDVIELVKEIPNDQHLGAAIRALFKDLSKKE